MQILIDGDGCPVVNETIKIGKRFDIPCKIICDTAHIFEKEGAETITVTKGSDSVDFALVNRVNEGDVVITQDYGLAAMCLAKSAIVLSQNGMVYDNNNIDSLLFQRYETQKIRMAGGRVKGNKKRKPEQNKDFEAALIRILEEN